VGFDPAFKQPYKPHGTVNREVAVAWEKVVDEVGAPPGKKYGPSAVSHEIASTQFEKFGAPANLAYDSRLLVEATVLVQERYARYLAGRDVDPVVDEGYVQACVDTLRVDKAVGQPFAAIDRVSKKDAWLDADSRFALLVAYLMALLVAAVHWIPTDPFAILYGLESNWLMGSLKRELRSEEKVLAGKTRLFMPSSIFCHAFQVVVFGRLSSVLHSLWRVPEFWTRVGMSKEYGEFDVFARRKQAWDETDTDDCNGFDSSIPAVLLGCGGWVMRSFLSPMWREMAREHQLSVIHSLVVLGNGFVMRKHRGGASGIFLTSDLNSICRCIVKTYELLRWAQEFAPDLVVTNELLDELVLVDVFGDDCTTSMRWNYNINFTRDTFSREARKAWSFELNIDVESDGVDGHYGVRHSFLSCGAGYDPVGRVYVPVSKRGSKVLWGLYFSPLSGDELLNLFHETLVIFAYDDEYWPWATKLFDAFAPGQRRARYSYQRRYWHGVSRP